MLWFMSLMIYDPTNMNSVFYIIVQIPSALMVVASLLRRGVAKGDASSWPGM